ncbi:MAG: thiamine phosphate synthase [Desulfobaccales bacterium]
MKGYYFITDAVLSRRGNLSDVKSALAAGVKIVQYRAKAVETRQMLAEAGELKKLCRGALFLVNDRVDVALAVGADGVHLGQGDLPYKSARRLLGSGKIIGISVSNLEEAQAAASQGADYVGVSPIFFTSTKADAGPPTGLTLLKEIRNEVSLPVVAIGGITLTNASEVIAAGADMICAISEVVSRPDVRGEIARFQKLFSEKQ